MPKPLLGRPDRQEPVFAGARIVLRVVAATLIIWTITGAVLLYARL
jgi:hypothetical protein